MSLGQSLCATHPPVDWVGSCQDTAPGIESCVYPSLRYGNTALLHDLVDGGAVNVAHLSRARERKKKGKDNNYSRMTS